MKICHITSAHTRYDVRIFRKECVSLAKAGYEVYLVVNDKLPNEKKENISIVSTGYVSKNRLDRMVNATREVLKKAVQIDAAIYHFHDPELLPVGNKLKKMGKRVIFDSHEVYSQQILVRKYLPKCIRHIVAKCYFSYETYVVRKIDAVIVPTTIKGKNIFENRAKQTIFINNVPQLEIFYENFRDNEKKDNMVCYTGSLSAERGIKQVAQAAYLAGVKLVLAGGYSSQTFQKEIEDMPEYSNIVYKGVVDKDEIIKIYLQCKIGMSTLLDKGQYAICDNMPTKVYEYMAMGMPVIMSDFPYLKKINDIYHFGICVNPENPEEISNAILFLLEQPDIAKACGENGRKAIAEKFNWDIEEKKLLKLYNELSDIPDIW